MELPHLGTHCSNKSCKQLDFLPMKCDACAEIFCGDHIMYNCHQCTESYKKDNQVPVCPLCNQPIPIKKNEVPDMVVGQHIDNDCQSDPARKRRKIYTNRCSRKGCKQKELIPVTCDKCQKNFCLKHRNEMDHDCQGFENSGRGISKTGAAAIFRNQSEPSKPLGDKRAVPSKAKPQQTTLTQHNFGRDLDRERRERQIGQRQMEQTGGHSIQGSMTEEEALARAIQMSMSDSQAPSNSSTSNRPMTQQEQDDLLLAQAIAASQEEATREQQRRRALKMTA
ncbi:AN1-type zinc finger protein 2A-like isoform X2 [Ylistrum balloti]|uniref:AN1-type zinc finger protein 2A-like isoform X2 n=1 Tax=Ylistrum balloti TaxID=509963 RepID=UPI002905EDBF|nr:AN1-type zinc finger protein 2A-like isoform X2 [Ylistrum balloti]